VEVKLTARERETYKSGGFDSMLARFNRQVQASGLFKEIKEHSFYEKPSTKRRRKLHEAKIKAARKEQKDAIRETRDPKAGGWGDKGTRSSDY